MLVEQVTATKPDGASRVVEVWAVGGAPHEIAYNEAGDRVFIPIHQRKIERRGRMGGYRFYGQYVTSDGFELRLALYTTDEDVRRGFKRTEHLRAFPPGSPDYLRLYPRRNDTESLNRQLEDQLWQKRANCYGRLGVHADMLGFALGQNAIARDVCRKRTGTAPPVLAAA